MHICASQKILDAHYASDQQTCTVCLCMCPPSLPFWPRSSGGSWNALGSCSDPSPVPPGVTLPILHAETPATLWFFAIADHLLLAPAVDEVYPAWPGSWARLGWALTVKKLIQKESQSHGMLTFTKRPWSCWALLCGKTNKCQILLLLLFCRVQNPASPMSSLQSGFLACSSSGVVFYFFFPGSIKPSSKCGPAASLGMPHQH